MSSLPEASSNIVICTFTRKALIMRKIMMRIIKVSFWWTELAELVQDWSNSSTLSAHKTMTC